MPEILESATKSAWLYQSVLHQRFAIYAPQIESSSVLPNWNRSWLVLCSTGNCLAFTCLFSHCNKYHAIRIIGFNSGMICHELDTVNLKGGTRQSFSLVACQAIWGQVLLTSRESPKRCVRKWAAADIKVKIPRGMCGSKT